VYDFFDEGPADTETISTPHIYVDHLVLAKEKL